MPLSIDVFWSFRSPYSYLATGRLVGLAADSDLEVNVRPVYPIAIRSEEFFDRVNPLWPPYLFRDTMRIAEMEGIPYRWPNPDPVVQLVDENGRRSTAKDQPYIHRLTRLGQLATERGFGLPFIREVSELIWTGTEAWDQGEHLAKATARAGLDLAEMDRVVVAEEARLEAAIEANQDALQAAGHWGVPTCVFEGEPFFGQDRLDMLVWRLEQHGLSRR